MLTVGRREFLQAGAGALALLGTGGRAEEPESEERLIRYENPKSYDVEHSVTILNQGALLTSLELWLPVPFTYNEQTVENVEITPKAPVYSDIYSQAKVARLIRVAGLPLVGRTLTFKVAYRVTARETKTDLKAMMAQPYQAYPQDKVFTIFTRPESKIETELPDIQKQAQALAGKRRPAASIARAIYDWVLDRTVYRLIDGLGGAEYCLENRHGECGDYSSLFVALCRAAGIPARVVTGFWADEVSGWHVWAEFRMPTGEWIPVDGSLGDGNAAKREHHFGFLDNRRVALARTADVQLKRVTNGHRKIDFLQIGGFWWKGKNIQRDPTSTFVAKGKAV